MRREGGVVQHRLILGLEESLRALNAMLDAASTSPELAPVAVAVVDIYGQPICFARADGASSLTQSIATRKAHTSAIANTHSGALGQRLAASGLTAQDLDVALTGLQGGLCVRVA